MFYPDEGYRSVTPLDAARVNRTIFHNHYLVCALILYNPHKGYLVGIIILSTILM